MIKENKGQLQFNQSIMSGVKIKRCHRTQQSYKKHVHQELSIGIIESGSTHVEFGNRPIEFNVDDGILVPPFVSHQCSPTDINDWQFIMIYIDPSYYSKKLSFTRPTKLTKTDILKVKNFIKQLETEVDRDLLEQSLIELLVCLETSTQVIDRIDSEKLSELKVAEVKDYITRHCFDEISLDLLEKLFDINRFTLIRQFRTLYDTTPRAYHLQVKVAKAKEYLEEKMDVFEICEHLRFYDQAHFIREFKKMNGVSPLVYMNSIHDD